MSLRVSGAAPRGHRRLLSASSGNGAGFRQSLRDVAGRRRIQVLGEAKGARQSVACREEDGSSIPTPKRTVSAAADAAAGKVVEKPLWRRVLAVGGLLACSGLLAPLGPAFGAVKAADSGAAADARQPAGQYLAVEKLKRRSRRSREASSSLLRGGRELLTNASYRSYRFQQYLQLPVTKKILLLMVATLPVILAFASLYRVASGASVRASLFRSYAVLTNAPGVDVTNLEDENGFSLLSMNVAAIFGLFTFAVFLGIILTDIEDRIYEMKKSSAYRLYERNHTVVLNWNRFTIPILRSMANAEPSHKISSKHSFTSRQPRKKTVVVIAEKDKEEMDELISGEDLGKSLRVIARSGNPSARAVLERAAVGDAASVIILQDEDGDLDEISDESTARFSREVGSLLLLNCIAGQPLNIVLQSNLASDTQSLSCKHPLTLAAAMTTAADQAQHQGQRKADRVAILSGREIFGRVMALSALQNEFCDVYREVSRRIEVSAVPPGMLGQPFGALSRAFPPLTAVGTVDAEGRVTLSPPPERRLAASDRLLALRADDKASLPVPASTLDPTSGGSSSSAKEGESPSYRVNRRARVKLPKKIAVLNASDHPISHGALQALLDCAPQDARISVVSVNEVPNLRRLLEKDKRIVFSRVEALTHQSLVDSRVTKAESILVLQDKSKSLPNQDAESNVIGLYLFDLFKGSKNPPSIAFSVNETEVLSDMRDAFLSPGLQHRVDVLSKEEVVSELFLTAAQHPALTQQLHDLLSAIVVVDVKDYLRASTRRGRGRGAQGVDCYDYASVVAAALAERDTVLGFQRSEGAGVEINPDRGQALGLGPDAKLVILSHKHLAKAK